MQERLLDPNQPGFCPSDFCINQLLAINMKYLKRLTVIQLQRLDQSFQIYQKYLTKCGMKACFLNSGPWVSQASFIIFLVTMRQISKGYFKQKNIAVETSYSRCSPGFNTESTCFLFTLIHWIQLFLLYQRKTLC